MYEVGKKYLYILLAVFIASCGSSNDEQSDSTNNAPVEQKNGTVQLFKTMGWQEQFSISPTTITVNTREENRIAGANDVALIIPACAFVNQKGECVDEAEVTYFLADKMSKILISGLTTFDESGRMLSSNGMFYINAQTPDGEQLSISQESSLLFETPQSRRHNDQGIYSGTEENGKIIWTAETGSEAVVNLSYSATDLYPDPYWLNTRGPYYQLADEKYDYTNMATFGMAERLRKSEGLSSYVAWLRDPDDRRISSSLLDIYVDNLDKPLYHSDSLVIDLVQKTLDSCLQSGGECLFKERIPSHIREFTTFKKQRLTFAMDFAPYLDALNSSNPKESLMTQGLSESESGYIISIYSKHQETTKELVKDFEDQKLVNLFRINKLGWANIDKLYTDEKMAYTKVKATVGSIDPDAEYRAYLHITRPNVLIALKLNGNEITINHEKEEYNFPVYDRAKIVVLGANDGETQLGITDIVLFEDAEYEVVLNTVSKEEFKAQLDALAE